jgi:hypothetical protein
MGLKPVVPAVVGAMLLAAGSAAIADEYKADEFLGLDLSKAVLSPKPLGPPTGFAPVAVEAKGDPRNDRSEPGWARNELKTEPRKIAVEDVRVAHPRRLARAAAEKRTHVAAERPAHVSAATGKPKGAARIGLARGHRNPLDAQAMDRRVQRPIQRHVQTWPCRTGGICNWKR